MALNQGLFTSSTDDWATPQSFFDDLNKEFDFELDVCASDQNAKCPKYFTKSDDGLSQEWTGKCWMNPPYGRDIGKWVQKAFNSVMTGGRALCAACFRRELIRHGGMSIA